MNLVSRFTDKWFLPSVLPFGILIFYIIPAIASIFIKHDPYALSILAYSTLSLSFFILVWAYKIDLLVVGRIMNLPKIPINASALAGIIAAAYFLFTVYVTATAPTVPLIDALHGKGIDEMAIGRETFLRTRTGWETWLNYAYAMFRSFLMPFAVCLMYHKAVSVRHLVLVAFLLSLMLTLEKSVAIFALLPVLYFFAQRRNITGAVMIVLLTATSMGITAYLARGGISSSQAVTMSDETTTIINSPLAPKSTKQHTLTTPDKKELLATLPKQYNIFSSDSQVAYVMNRIFYIPYITAHEWLRYQDEKLDGGYTYGRSISLVAYLTGKPKLNLEREVFNFQWGQNETGTGSANSAYFIDAFLNFGIFGCLLYTFVAASIIRMATLSKLRVMEACILVPTLFLLFNSLTAMIFSGGLFLMILFSLTMTEREEADTDGEANPL